MCESLDIEPHIDHLDKGTQFLREQCYPRKEYLAASYGRGPEGAPQVLIMGGSHIEIRAVEGRVLLDAGVREIGGVRFAVGIGLEVWVTTRPGGESFGKRQWGHHLPDEEAKYLEDLWLQTAPFMHSGVQLNRRPWRVDEYAYYVGRALTEAAECEVRIASLLSNVAMLGFGLKKSPKGKSGTQLAELLNEVGMQSPAFRDLAERYRAWYKWRNFSAHGVRYDEKPERPSHQVFKMKAKSDGTGEDFEVRNQDFQDLARLWSAFYSLNHDVSRIAMDLYRSKASIEKTLRTLAMSNPVPAADRMP